MYFLASVSSACSDPGLASILAIVKKVLTLFQIIGPILAIISIAFRLTMLMKNPDDKKGLPKLRNSAIALLVLFLVPAIVNAAFAMLGDSFQISSCWNNASINTGGGGSYVDPNGDDSGKRTKVYTDPSEYQNGKKDGNKKNTENGNSGNDTSNAGDRPGNGNTTSSKVVFIGDSRTVQMYAYVSGDWGGANYSSGGVHVVGNDVYVAEGSMGLSWLKNTGISAAKSYFNSGTAIVILMGVNDLSNASNYITYINSNAATWKNNGSSLYFVSVNPCEGSYSHLNSKIDDFNSQLRSGLSTNVGWIDTNSHLKQVGFHTTDGLHYDKSTSEAIYNYIKSKV